MVSKEAIWYPMTNLFVRREMFYDRRFEAALETAAEAEQAAATASGGELGGDIGELGGAGIA